MKDSKYPQNLIYPITQKYPECSDKILQIHNYTVIQINRYTDIKINSYTPDTRDKILQLKKVSYYQKIADIGSRFIDKDKLFKYGFNWSPMYRRSTSKIMYASKDLLNIKIKLRLNYKNRNYANSIFGGSMFSAVDPIPMVQLINILGKEYVVWDKSAEIKFKRPAKETLFAQFIYSKEEIEEIKEKVAEKNEIEIYKTTHLTNASEEIVFCEVKKTIYVADKKFYKEKKRKRELAK